MQLYHEKNAGGIHLQKQEPKGLSCLSLQSLTSLGCLVFPLRTSQNLSRI